MKAYVYTLQGPPETLRTWAQLLGQPFYHWVANLARLTVGAGVPEDWQAQGAIFGPKGELRWWQEDLAYRALLLTDEPMNGLDPLPGDWTAEEEDFFLQDLNDRKLKPKFAAYPSGDATGRCRARIYYRDGVAVFVSPRELMKGGERDATR